MGSAYFLQTGKIIFHGPIRLDVLYERNLKPCFECFREVSFRNLRFYPLKRNISLTTQPNKHLRNDAFTVLGIGNSSTTQQI